MKLWTLLLLVAAIAVMVIVPSRRGLRVAEEAALEPRELARLPVRVDLPPARLSVAPITDYEPIVRPTESHKPLFGTKIVIDPGHGGQHGAQQAYTGGTIGVATKQTESEVNLRVSMFLRHYLEHAGAEVLMTRTTDDRVSTGSDKTSELDLRSDLANAIEADLFISVHHNMSPNAATNFTTVFYPPNIPNSVVLAENISGAVAAYLGTKNVGAKEGAYRVLNRVNMPGVIVEASFMSNHAEDLKLQALDYNKDEAKGIATGILNYMRAVNGLDVDFDQVFEPAAMDPKAMADATLVGRHIVEHKSLFGTRYAEVVYDANGRVTEWREINDQKLARPTNSRTPRPIESTTPPIADQNDADVDPVAMKSSPRPTLRKEAMTTQQM
jgi:N-acetylmuramoyl-L-alanine amidase